VGSYNPTSGLQINQQIQFYDAVGQPVTSIVSSCDHMVSCSNVCGNGAGITPKPPTNTSVPVVADSDRGGLIAGVVVMVLLFALCFSVLVVIVWCALRRGRIPCLGAIKKDDYEGDWGKQSS
jgi:hypothetical protein